ncbi:MAG: 4Fe-4S binding protein [Desulfuromonadales bacterium]|nr:4Fe-4S binding protein [Desulfuromonadales bacterium]
MNMESTGLIYFSPTHTTRKVLEGIAQGLQATDARHFDLTQPDAIPQSSRNMNQDLVVIGAPVYAGRLPPVMVSRFKRIRGNGVPAVIVVVYGNREYEDALIELRDLALEAGFRPMAAGAFIGEHSYSTTDLPIAAGRPDAGDMAKAQEFGKSIRAKLMTASGELSECLQVPGSIPYKEVNSLPGIAPATNEAVCTKCATCVSACPTAAIDRENPGCTDTERCIRCCACVKVCPVKAKSLDDPRIKQIAAWLHANFSDRKEPETYV